jgi:hypothetical protein
VRSVEFAFWVRDRVVNPLGVDGIVTMVGIDDGEKKTCFVTTANSGQWWPEDQLTKKEGM